MSEIRWEDPPVASRAPRGWITRLEPLKAHPKRWARLHETRQDAAYKTAADLRAGRVLIPPGRWEFIGRAVGNGRGAIYARYLGEGDA